jgi:CHAT domain-containing protein
MKQLLISFFLLVTLPVLGQGQTAADSTRMANKVDSLIKECRALTDQRKYTEALQVIDIAQKQATAAFGTASLHCARCIYNQGRVNQIMGNYTEAEPLIFQAMAMIGHTVGKENIDYASCNYSLGVLYQNKSELDKAESFYLEARTLLEKALKKEHPIYIGCLNNLANVYRDKGKYDKAEAMHLEVLAIREKLFGKEHPDYAMSLYNLGSVFMDKGEYYKAKALFIESKNIREKIFGKENLAYVQSLNSLALIYSYTSDYDQSISLFREAMNIQKKILGKETVEYTVSLNNLSNNYRNKGDFEQAISLSSEARSIIENLLGKGHFRYAGSLFNLALVYHDMGEYDKAEILLLETKSICEKVYGKEHPRYAKTLEQLALGYYRRGEYEKAKAVFEESLAILEKTLGKEHPSYGNCMANLALVYHDKGDLYKAQSYYVKNISIVEKVHGKTSPDYATCISNLATLYQDLGAYDTAIGLHLESMAIWETVYGKQNKNYASALIKLANIYLLRNEYNKAEPMFLESKSIYEKIFGKEHERYADVLYCLALIYLAQGDLFNAASYFLATNSATISLLQKMASYSSEKEILGYHALFEKRLETQLQYTQAHPTDALIATAYNNALAFNNALLFNNIAREKSIAQADSSTRAVYREWKSCHFQLAKQYTLPKSDRDSARVAALEEQANGYEKELVRRAPDFVKSQQTINWQDVKQQLKPGEAALEFVHYNINTKGKKADSTFYAALLIRPEWTQPRMVKLFEQRDLQPLLAAANTTASTGQLYAARGVQNGQKNTRGNQGQGIVIPGPKSANLYQLSWAPIDSLLKDCNTVYYAPSGLLHRLNLGAIAVPGTDQTLADRYQLVQLGSTRQLIGHERNTIASTRTATLFGGLRYDADAPVANADSTDQMLAAYDVASLRSALGGRGGDAWVYLPGTEKEIKNAGAALKNAGFVVKTFSGNQGTEAAFKTLGQLENPAPTVLHIATHGFFFPDPKDSTNRNVLRDDREPVFKTSDNPLLRSGLILAGANPAWSGTRAPETQEDGILTAYEISQMNLRGTELVVLSACETGLGDVEDNEGVYGLKRAFKIAGARYLIMSLWQVPDKQTQELMSVFYKNWLEQKMDIPAAFAAAQKSMRKRYSDPFFWAGFVLVE